MPSGARTVWIGVVDVSELLIIGKRMNGGDLPRL